MEQEVGKMQKLFTQCPAEGKGGGATTVVAKVAGGGKGVNMLATTAGGDGYLGSFDERALRKIGGGSPDWVKFFTQLASAFAACGCTAAVDGRACRIDVPSVGAFELARDEHVGHAQALSNIVSFTRMRTAKDPDKLMKEAEKRESESRTRSEQLQKEEQQLTQQLEASRQRDAANRTRLAQLEEEFSKLEEGRREQAKAAGEQQTQDEEDEAEAARAARVRNPLGDAEERREYDLEVLRVVKSAYVQWDDPVTPEHHWLDTVRPLNSDEWSAIQASGSTDFNDRTKQSIYDALRKIDEWDYDVFHLQEVMAGSHDHRGLVNQRCGGSLSVTIYALLMRHGLLQKFNMRESRVLSWMSVVEAGYHPNPYHNSMHAADVLHITHYILAPGGLISVCNLSDFDIFAAIFAAAIHDYNHPGINNNFHIKAQTYLAVLYNDRSILENIHVSSVFELMKMDKFNIFECFTDDQKRDIRETIIEMVLATDMGLHAKILGTFKRRLAEDHSFTKKDDIRLAMNMALKMADISNCGRPEPLYMKWCNKICDEFYMQGDRERNAGMQCSPFMDRYQPSMAKGQIAFMNYIVIPLFECISEFLPDMHFSVDYTENNRSYWANSGDES